MSREAKNKTWMGNASAELENNFGSCTVNMCYASISDFGRDFYGSKLFFEFEVRHNRSNENCASYFRSERILRFETLKRPLSLFFPESNAYLPRSNTIGVFRRLIYLFSGIRKLIMIINSKNLQICKELRASRINLVVAKPQKKIQGCVCNKQNCFSNI